MILELCTVVSLIASLMGEGGDSWHPIRFFSRMDIKSQHDGVFVPSSLGMPQLKITLWCKFKFTVLSSPRAHFP